jgi:hybrid cluster-associated redox disulfide protein
MEARITNDMIIGDILALNADGAPFVLERGMQCLGCPSARGETLAEACAVHGVDVSDMTDRLNEFISNN